MTYVILKAPIQLHRGCPLNWRVSPDSIERVSFVRHAERFIGLLDPRGRKPGVYVDPTRLIVEHDKTEMHVWTEDISLADTYPSPLAAELVPAGGVLYDSLFLRELPYPIELHPDDMVQEIINDGGEISQAMVRAVVLDVKTGSPIYHMICDGHLTIRTHGVTDKTYVTRGNVYKLYHDEPLVFASDAEEAAFWGRVGVHRRPKKVPMRA